MQYSVTGPRVVKWFWIAVLAVIGFGLLSNFGPMAILVCGFIVLWVKGFIWAARNNKGTLLQDENGKWYRAFEVEDEHHWIDDYMNDYKDPTRTPFAFRMMRRIKKISPYSLPTV